MRGANIRLFILEDVFCDLDFFVFAPIAVFSRPSFHLLHLLMIILLASASFAKESAAIFPFDALLPPSILQVCFVVLSYSQMQDGEFELQEADAGGHLWFAWVHD